MGDVKCVLAAVSVKGVSGSTAELRLLFDGCSNGRRAVTAISVSPLGPSDDPAAVSNLVPWMCEIAGTKCVGTTPDPSVTSTSPSGTSTAAPGHIHVGREALETLVGTGRCNDTSFNATSVTATTRLGCQAECMQRFPMQLSSLAVDLGQPCSGYSWSASSSSCTLYRGDPNLQLASADNNTGWQCYNLRAAGDSYGFDQASQPTTTTMPAPVVHHESLNLSTLLNIRSAKYAIRRQVLPTDGNCFDPVDWYQIETSISIGPDDWNTLQVIVANWPNTKDYAVVPASQVVD